MGGEDYSHYAKKVDVTRGIVEGTEIVSLCGYSGDTGEGGTVADRITLPMCPECERRIQEIKEAEDGGDF